MPLDNKFYEKLNAWQAVIATIKTMAPLLEQEKAMRIELFGDAFPAPKEGTNNLDLMDGWKLKGNYKIDRKLDEAVLETVMAAVRGMGVNPDPCIERKPSLALKAYKALPVEAQKLFDTALTIKPALPTIEIVPPSKKD